MQASAKSRIYLKNAPEPVTWSTKIEEAGRETEAENVGTVSRSLFLYIVYILQSLLFSVPSISSVRKLNT